MRFLDKYLYQRTIPRATARRLEEACDIVTLSHRMNGRADCQKRLLTYYDPQSHKINTIFLMYDNIKRYRWSANKAGDRYCYVTQFDKWDKILFEVYFVISNVLIQIDHGIIAKAAEVEFPEDQEVIGRAVQRQLFEWPDAVRPSILIEDVEANRSTYPNYAANTFSSFAS